MLDKVPSSLKTKPGVYVISQYSNPSVANNSRVLVKVGMAKDSLYSRIDSYHTALPKSFWFYTCIITKNRASARKLEKYLHNRMKNYLYKHEEYNARRSGEWFKIRKYMLINILNEAIVENYDDVRGIFNYNKRFFAINLPEGYESDRPKRTNYIYKGR